MKVSDGNFDETGNPGRYLVTVLKLYLSQEATVLLPCVPILSASRTYILRNRSVDFQYDIFCIEKKTLRHFPGKTIYFVQRP